MPVGSCSSSAVSTSHGRRPNYSSKISMFSSWGQFLQHLELDRGNCTRTRNYRLAAIHSFFQYVAISEPARALQCQRVLAIPSKRYERGPVEFLTEEETAALVAAPDPGTWIGRRDKALLLVAIQTGLRNSEITSLCRQDVEFGTGAHVRCLGKGRKMRCTPLRPDVAAVLKEWLSQQGEWTAPQLRRVPATRLTTYQDRMSNLSVTDAEEGDSPHLATRGRHGPAASRCGSQRDRSLARPRIDRNDPDLPTRGHAAKGTRARPRDFIRPRT